jgi:hypothetical protein
MPFREKGLNERVFSQSVPLSRPAPVQTGAKVRGFSPTGLEFTAETDSLLEGTGFEPSVPLLGKGLSAVAEPRCRTDKIDEVIRHRSSRETTVVERGPLSTAVH